MHIKLKPYITFTATSADGQTNYVIFLTAYILYKMRRALSNSFGFVLKFFITLFNRKLLSSLIVKNLKRICGAFETAFLFNFKN